MGPSNPRPNEHPSQRPTATLSLFSRDHRYDHQKRFGPDHLELLAELALFVQGQIFQLCQAVRSVRDGVPGVA